MTTERPPPAPPHPAFLSPPPAPRHLAPPQRPSWDQPQGAKGERDGVCSLTSQRLVHASNAAIQLQDAQGLHAHDAAAAASELGLPVPISLLPPPALLPRLWFRGFSVPPLLPPRLREPLATRGPGAGRGQRGDNGHKTIRPPK